MSYVLYSSQIWQLESKPMYLGKPNFYQGTGPRVMGLPFIINTDKLTEAMQFHYKGQCREFMKNKNLTGYKIIPLDKASGLVLEYANEHKKRKEKYKMTEAEKLVLRKFEEFK